MEQTNPLGTVLITGAAQRIGQAIALELAHAGYSIVIHYSRSDAEAHALVEQIQDLGVRACALQAHFEDETQVEDLIPRACSIAGPLSALINNASIFERDEALSATRESWSRHLNVNSWAPFVLSQAFARQLPIHSKGCIVNLLDSRVQKPTAHYTSYTVSKAALWTLTQTLALALSPSIRVNAIAPGRTLPNNDDMVAQFQQHWERMPLRRGTTPREIAHTILFLLEAPSITGQLIALDGGEHLM